GARLTGDTRHGNAVELSPVGRAPTACYSTVAEPDNRLLFNCVRGFVLSDYFFGWGARPEPAIDLLEILYLQRARCAFQPQHVADIDVAALVIIGDRLVERAL